MTFGRCLFETTEDAVRQMMVDRVITHRFRSGPLIQWVYKQKQELDPSALDIRVTTNLK